MFYSKTTVITVVDNYTLRLRDTSTGFDVLVSAEVIGDAFMLMKRYSEASPERQREMLEGYPMPETADEGLEEEAAARIIEEGD